MRFSIRDILLLTVIAAVATAWGLDRWRLARRAAELELRNQVLTYEAQMSRAHALLERESALTALKRSEALLDAQKAFAELAEERTDQRSAK